ncbi:MAG: hypothetical protein U1C71_04610, partial [archaeon]|nr:hypothetical protein [archaeon]
MAPKPSATKKKPSSNPWVLGVAILAVLGIGLYLVSSTSLFTGLVTGAAEPISPDIESGTNNVPPASSFASPNSVIGPRVDPATLSKARYLKEVFKVDRDKYDIYEKAAANMGLTLEETKQFFLDCCDLASEEQIFSQLPPVPYDFPEVAYDLQVGNIFQLGNLGHAYYSQPEFHFQGTELAVVNQYYAFIGWINPSLNYWGDSALRTYPDTQHDTISHSGRRTFSAIVFATNGWNIQNYVGVQFVPNGDAAQYFDITIREEKTGQPYFLLGPTFPVFDKDWATRVTIEGTVKDDTPPGVYVVGINPTAPPRELSTKWSNEHKGLYATMGYFRPADN